MRHHVPRSPTSKHLSGPFPLSLSYFTAKLRYIELWYFEHPVLSNMVNGLATNNANIYKLFYRTRLYRSLTFFECSIWSLWNNGLAQGWANCGPLRRETPAHCRHSIHVVLGALLSRNGLNEDDFKQW